MKEYKAYIFDMDLTLLNTLVTAKKSYCDAFKAVGCEFDDNTLTHHLSISLRETYAEFDSPKGSVEVFIEAFRKTANATFLNDSFFYEDGITLIHKLVKAGKKIGIVTNREYKNVVETLEKEGKINTFVSSIVTCDRVKNLKPNPEPILKCVEELGVETKDACYIGDAFNDYKAATSAGVDFIAIERYDNCKFGADNVVHSLLEVF